MTSIRRVEIECVFRGRGRRREFTTRGNHEAFNLLRRRLDEAGAEGKLGKLVFEFVPSKPKYGSRHDGHKKGE